MKITYLLTWPHEMGGTERSVITQAEALSRRHDVEIVGVMSWRTDSFFPIPRAVPHRILVRTSAEGADGVPLSAEGVDLPAERLGDLYAAPSRLVPAKWEPAFSQLTDLAVSRWFAKLDCDVLVTTTPPLLALASQLAPECTVVVHQEHRTSECRGASLAPLVAHGPRADAVAFLTERTVEHFRDLWGAASPALLRVHNPLAPVLRPVSSHDRPLVVSAGRLAGEKRFDHLIDAFAAVTAEQPDWTLRIFGDGPQEAALRRQVARLGLTDHVELMGRSTVMTAELASASIVTLSSRSEGLPLVVQEAMAAGTAVVSYDCPNGPAELITSDQDGVLVDNGDVGALASALLGLIGDPGRRRELGRMARLRAQAFGARYIAGQWEQHFETLLGDVRPGETRLERIIRRST